MGASCLNKRPTGPVEEARRRRTLRPPSREPFLAPAGSRIVTSRFPEPLIPHLNYNRSISARRGRPLAAHGIAVGLIRYKTLSPVGAPHDDATLSDGPGRLGCPFRAYSFLGTVFPWRCHGLKEECPLRGVRFGKSLGRFSEQGGTINSRGSLR